MSLVVCSQEINLIVYTLVAFFAISSWIDINGLWVELPILVQKLPEGWNLPSYMSVIIQVANIGPLAFTISNTIWPRKVRETPVIYVIISVGAVACMLLAFFWDTVTIIAGNLHSTALLTLQFFLALVDCTSSVAFYPFMALFKPQYMTALFIGESLSGLLPSLVALVQGAGDITCINSTTIQNITANASFPGTIVHNVYPMYRQPKFSIEIFFFFLFTMMIISGIAFTLLNYLPYCKKEHLLETDSIGTTSDLGEVDYNIVSTSDNTYELSDNSDKFFIDAANENNSNSALLSNRRKAGISIEGGSKEPVTIEMSPGISSSITPLRFSILAVLTTWVNALTNGVLPSVQSYSCLPYGNDAYHLTVALSNIASPLSCLLVFFVQVKMLHRLCFLTVMGTFTASYIMAMAVMSPEPLFIHGPAGVPLIIISWVLTSFILTYTKVAVAYEFRVGGRKALLWCGVFTQIGSAAGALIMFILINPLNYFKQAILCPT